MEVDVSKLDGVVVVEEDRKIEQGQLHKRQKRESGLVEKRRRSAGERGIELVGLSEEGRWQPSRPFDHVQDRLRQYLRIPKGTVGSEPEREKEEAPTTHGTFFCEANRQVFFG